MFHLEVYSDPALVAENVEADGKSSELKRMIRDKREIERSSVLAQNVQHNRSL